MSDDMRVAQDLFIQELVAKLHEATFFLMDEKDIALKKMEKGFNEYVGFTEILVVPPFFFYELSRIYTLSDKERAPFFEDKKGILNKADRFIKKTESEKSRILRNRRINAEISALKV